MENKSSKASSTPRNDDWRKYDKSLNKSIALEDLRDSVRQKDEDRLEKAIARCRDGGLQDNERVKEAAEIHLPVISARNRLQKACRELEEKGDDDGVKRELQSIKKDGLSPYLHLEVRQAKNLLERHKASKQKEKPKAAPLAMDTKTVAEIRRYHNPISVVHKVVQAVLLLMGEDEDTTDSWKNCQRICNPYGNDGLCRKVMNFEPSKVHPEIVARAKQIMDTTEFNEVQAVGRGAPVTFYVWAMGSIEKAEAAAKEDEKKEKKEKPDTPKGATTDSKKDKPGAHSDNSKVDNKTENEEVKPASRKRQKEIFGRLPSQHDNFYNVTISPKKKSKAKTDGNPHKPTTNDKTPKQ